MDNTIAVITIDPPNGSAYGFPKIIPVWVTPENLDWWIVQVGYPRGMRDDVPYKLRGYLAYPDELPDDYFTQKVGG